MSSRNSGKCVGVIGNCGLAIACVVDAGDLVRDSPAEHVLAVVGAEPLQSAGDHRGLPLGERAGESGAALPADLSHDAR